MMAASGAGFPVVDYRDETLARGSTTVPRHGSRRNRGRVSPDDSVVLRGLVNASDVLASVPVTARRGTRDGRHFVFRPQSRGGGRPRSQG